MDTANTVDFGGALEALRNGRLVARSGWNAHHMLALQNVLEGSPVTEPFICMYVAQDAKDMQGARIPWVASQTDLLATDWYVVSPTGAVPSGGTAPQTTDAPVQAGEEPGA